MINPIGLHIQAQDGRIDRFKLYGHVNTAQYGTVTVLDNFDVAAQIARDLPDCIVLLRYYKEEEWNPDKETAVEHFHRRRPEWQAIIDAGLQDHVFLCIDCESQMTQVRCDGYADMIEEAVKVGVGLAVGGNSSGSVLSGWGEPNGWYTIGRRLLITLSKYKHLKRYFIRHHHYTTYYEWSVSNGLAPSHENARWEKRPQKIDWSLPQWHIGRDCYGIMKTCDALGIAYPWTIIDECGLDDMADIQGRIPNVKLDGSDKAGGWRTLETQLHEWYELEPGEAYANMLIWAWETVYKPLGFVIGMHVFTYGDASPVEIRRFEKYRVDNAPAYLRRMETYSQTEAPAPAPEPQPIPVPAPVPTPTPAPIGLPDNWALGGLLLAIGILIGFFVRDRLLNTAAAQSVEVSIMWESLIILAGACNRTVEGFKKLLAFTPWFSDPEAHPELRRLLTLVASMVIGIVMVAAANQDGVLFAGTEFSRYPNVFVTIVFGLATGAGANFLAWLQNVWEVNRTVKLATATQGTTSAKVSVETHTAEPAQTIELKQAIDKISKEVA